MTSGQGRKRGKKGTKVGESSDHPATHLQEIDRAADAEFETRLAMRYSLLRMEIQLLCRFGMGNVFKKERYIEKKRDRETEKQRELSRGSSPKLSCSGASSMDIYRDDHNEQLLPSGL